MSESADYSACAPHLGFLRMTAAAEALPTELDHARAAGLTHQGFVERLLPSRWPPWTSGGIPALARFASLPSPVTLADFDFSAQPSVDPKLIVELGTLRCMEDATNVLLIGPLATVAAAVVDDPEHPPGRGVGLGGHHLFDESAEGLDAGLASQRPKTLAAWTS